MLSVTLMKTLSHNGIIIPKYEPKGFSIVFKGRKIELTPEQEEMAVAWVRKLGTEYVEDKVFIKNFFDDFCKALNVKGSVEDFDFSEIKKWVDKDREAKLSMSKEEKKRLAAERKIIREANKEKHGYAMIDGQGVELGNYMAEPSSIFMGRGKHPLRGKWKQGAKESDIILNLSPDSVIPQSSLKIDNYSKLEKFINKFSHCNSGGGLLLHLTKLNGQKNITKKSIEKLERIQNFMRNFLMSTENGVKLIESLQEILGEYGSKNLKLTHKNMQNINGKRPNNLEYIEKLNLESVLTGLEKLTFLKSAEADVNSVETAISEFLYFITEPQLKEKLQSFGKEATIGEILKKEKICRYCVVTAIGLFTCLKISMNMPWKEVVWAQNLWIAKWDDKLRGKEKYVWVSDTSPMKQEREIEKFEKAKELEKKFGFVKSHIGKNLDSTEIKKRKIATVCYLIDALSMRVGDEKDEDEADTVGATTLTPKNIEIENNLVKFNFIGKDYVEWKKEVVLPENVVKNLKEFIKTKNFVFDGVRSEDVNAFLSEIVDGITAKVFRTYHASKAVREYLENVKVKKDDPESYKKYIATMANLQAAIVCNHKRKLPKKWKESLEKKQERLKQLKLKKGKKTKEKVKEAKLKIDLMKETKDYNLNTSLKSYVDPRIFYKWAKKVDFDWKKYYSKTLQKKFSWIEKP